MRPKKGEIWKSRKQDSRRNGELIRIIHDESEVFHPEWTIAWVYFDHQKWYGFPREADKIARGWDNASHFTHFQEFYEPDEASMVERLINEYDTEER